MSRYTRYQWDSIACLAIGLCGLSACTGDSDTSGAQSTDSAGVEIVLSPGADRTLDWQFAPVFSLGGSDEGPESFFLVSSRLVEADAAGNLFILDPQNSRIVVFDTDGQFLRSIGSSGGGPGEFQAPGTFSVSSDGAVAVFDFGKGSLVRFDGNGEIADQQLFPLYPTPVWQQRHFSLFGDTTLVSTSTSPMDPGVLTQRLRQIVDADTLVLAELPLPPVEMVMFEECGGVSIPQLPIFAPELAWATQPGMVAFSSSVEYSVSFTKAGNLTRIVRREIVPTPASREQAILHVAEGSSFRFRENICHADPPEVVDKRGYSEIIPTIGTVMLSPSGELWVERFMVDKEAIALIDVFDASGAYIGTIERESFSPVVLLPGDRVGVVEKDESDVERLVVLAIQR